MYIINISFKYFNYKINKKFNFLSIYIQFYIYIYALVSRVEPRPALFPLPAAPLPVLAPLPAAFLPLGVTIVHSLGSVPSLGPAPRLRGV
jgi:hypothetical protein